MAVTSVIESMRTNLTNAYASIEAKGAQMPEDKNLENLAATIDSLSGEGGGSGNANINGLIEQYYVYAGDNINAGDFVRFIEGVASKTPGEKQNTATVTTCVDDGTLRDCYVRGLALDDKRVFITYTFYAGRYAEVITINEDGTITRGQSLQISTDERTIDVMIKLADNMVFSFFDYNVNGGQANVYRIDGTTIVRYLTSADLTGYNGNRTGLTQIDDTHIFCTYDGYNSNEIGTIAVIGENDITFTGDYSFTWNNMSYYRSRNYTLSDGKIFTIYGAGRGVIWEVTPTKVTVITNAISNLPASSDEEEMQEIIQVEPNKFLFIYRNSSNLCGKLVSIENNLAVVGNEIILATDEEGFSPFTTQQINNKQFLVSYATWLVTDEGLETEAWESILQGIVITLNDDYSVNNVTAPVRLISADFNPLWNICTSTASTMSIFPVGQENQNNYMVCFDVTDDQSDEIGHYMSLINVDTETNAITVSYTYDSANIVYETQVQKATSNPFDGVAKTAGTGGTPDAHQDQIEIYTL